MKRTDWRHKLGIVLLAAGGSSRMGRPKQLLQIEGEALVTRVSRRLVELESDSVMVVTGSAAQAVNDQLSGLPIQIVHNPRWEEGMASSLAAGVKNLPAEIEGALIVLCDQWQVGLADLQKLVQAWNTDISRIAAACWQDEGQQVIGPPAIFPRALFGELFALNGDRGARAVIEKHRERTFFVAMKNARFDLDEPADTEVFPG
ncbi:MAG: nucleotidyltransferase family protein [Xanthomonadales bacterium]